MAEHLLNLARQAVEMAKKSGADHAFVSASKNREVELTVRDGKVEQVKEAGSKSMSIRIWADGRFGSHRSNDLRLEQLSSFIKEAVALTRAVQPDKHRKITDPSLYPSKDLKNPELELFDPAIKALTREDRLAICMMQNERFKGKEGVISATSGVSDSTGSSAMVSSNGFEGSQESSSMWLGSEVTMKDTGDKKPEAWMWGGARHRSQTPDPKAVADLALKRAKAMLGSKKGPSQKTLMIVDPSAGPRLLSRLIGPASGRSLSQGRSFWKERIGKKSVSEKLNIKDMPLLPRGFSSRFYDSEGIAAKEMPIIEAGVLRNLYINTYYGSKLDMTPTTGGRSNIVIGGGNRKLSEIIADTPKAVYVTSWLGGNSDGASGDFSFGLRGHLIKDGKLAEPVGEMNITGNLLTLFSSLAEVGNDPWLYSSIGSPTLVFEGVDFSGT